MIISADASQLEWRTAVELSHDEVGLSEILDHADTHSLNQSAFELPSRLIAKIYLFRTIFRGSGWAFANDADFSHVSSSAKFWEGINEKFYSKYHGLDAQHKKWAATVMQGKPIVGPLGRSWSIPLKRKEHFNFQTGEISNELALPWTRLTNYPVQGTGADVMKIARVVFYKRIKERRIPCKFITTVHDSIVVDADSKYLPEIAALFHETFAAIIPNIKLIFGYEWRTPLECEVKYGMDFKDMVKFK